VRLTDLSCDRSPDGSLHAFASGQSFHPLSAPLQDGIRFFHHPLPTTAADNLTVTLVCHTGQTPRWAYHVPYKQQSWEGSVISPVTTCQRVRTKQANNRSHAFWQSPIKQVAFGSYSFTTFINGSLALTNQLSLAPHSDATAEITPRPLTGYGVPRKVATLSERLGPHRYQ
jgi:hypothetical protein